MSSAYPISAPVDFTNTTAGDELLFNAVSGASKNKILDFVASAPGDILYRSSVGTAGQVLTVPLSATPQTNTVQVTAEDANTTLNDNYFLIDSPTNSYYVWYNTAAGGTDPNTIPANVTADLLLDNKLRTGVEVAVAAADTAIDVATATAAALNALPDFGATSGGTDTVTVVNALGGVVSSPLAGFVPPVAFVYAIGVLGVSASPAWVDPSPGSTGNTFLAEGTGTGAGITAGSAWVTISATELTWNNSTSPNHDAGSVFAPATGVFTIPSDGVYSLSASVALAGNSTGNGSGGIPGRRAVRQARLLKSNGTPATLAFKSEQAQPSNLNPTQLSLVVASTSLLSGDTVVLQVRHDATSDILLNVNEESAVQGPSNYFSATKVA
jgi:hypothetical protein